MREKLIEEKNIIVQEGQRGIKSCHFPLHKIKAFIHPWHVQVMFFQGKKKTFPTRLSKACPPIFPSTQKQQNFRRFSVFCRQGEASFWAMLPAKPFGFLVLFRLPR
jgi:hypothetical protein